MADLNKSTGINQDNPQLELVNSGNTTKQELVEGLSEDKLECPYPNHEGYAKVRNTLSPKEQKEMKENIKITDDGKIEIIKMKKKFSMLIAEHNGRNIFDGSHTDKNGKIGVKGVTYLTGDAAERECDNQGKKLLINEAAVRKFIGCFPGGTEREKIFNFVNLFGLEKAGYWDSNSKEWYDIGSIGFVALSEVDYRGYVYGVRWNDGNGDMPGDGWEDPSPFLASESLN